MPLFHEVGRRSLWSFKLPEADQEDLLSQTIEKLIKGGLEKFYGSTNIQLLAYLKRIVQNEAINLVKMNKRLELASSSENQASPSQGSIEEVLANDECSRILANIVQNLPPHEQQLYLNCCQVIKIREIAAKLGVPSGTIGARISRLKANLRKSLKDRGC